MSTLSRYWVFQIPGISLVAILLFLVHRLEILSAAGCVVAMIGWLVKDAALYPYLRKAYERSAPAGVASFVGQQGRVLSDLEPDGWILVRGERWKARLATSQTADTGTKVEITGVDGRLLVVRPLTSSEGPLSSGDKAR